MTSLCLEGVQSVSSASWRRSLVLVLVALVYSLLWAGCPHREKPAEARLTVLNLWHTFNPEETATLNKILERLREQQPSWQIQATVIPFARAQNEFRQAAQRCGPGAPDVFRAELPWLAEFIAAGLLRPVPEQSPAEAGYLPRAKEAARYRGQRWTLPASLDCLALLYNQELIEQPPQTLEQLVQLGRAATRDAAGRGPEDPLFDSGQAVQWGFYVRGDAYWFLPFLWALGGDLLAPEAGEVYIDQPPAARALGYYRDLIRVQRIAPPRPSPSNDYEDQLRRFAAGELAMMVNGPWVMGALLKLPRFSRGQRLGIAPFPRGADERPAAPYSGHGWVVSSCAKDPAQAWQLASELSNLEAQVAFAQANILLPALGAAYQRPELRANAQLQQFRAALDSSRARPKHPAIARIFDDFTPAVQAVLLGDAKPAEALQAVGRAWRRLIGKTNPTAAKPTGP